MKLLSRCCSQILLFIFFIFSFIATAHAEIARLDITLLSWTPEVLEIKPVKKDDTKKGGTKSKYNNDITYKLFIVPESGQAQEERMNNLRTNTLGADYHLIITSEDYSSIPLFQIRCPNGRYIEFQGNFDPLKGSGDLILFVNKRKIRDIDFYLSVDNKEADSNDGFHTLSGTIDIRSCPPRDMLSQR